MANSGHLSTPPGSLLEARERLARIERLLGVLALDGMPVEVELAILRAWWDSRIDVPDDDPLRVSMLEEREEYARQMGVLDAR